MPNSMYAERMPGPGAEIGPMVKVTMPIASTPTASKAQIARAIRAGGPMAARG